MKVILRKNYETLGNAGDIVNVKDGYARNFLILKSLHIHFCWVAFIEAVLCAA